MEEKKNNYIKGYIFSFWNLLLNLLKDLSIILSFVKKSKLLLALYMPVTSYIIPIVFRLEDGASIMSDKLSNYMVVSFTLSFFIINSNFL